MKILRQVVLISLVLPSISATLGPHPKLIRAEGDKTITGQYIIELDPTIPDSRSFATKVLKRAFQNNLIETYDYAFKGFSVKDIPDTLLNLMLNMKDVLSISEDTVVEANAIQRNPTWGLDITDGQDDNRYNYTYTGRGVDVYILDTGIYANHPELEGRVKSCVSYTGEGKYMSLHLVSN
jgi:subtilisin family serine protease